LNWSSEHMDAWQFLDYSIKTGKSSFEYVYKQPFFNYLNSNSDRLKSYHKAMFEYARVDYRQLPTIVDFGLHKTIMDVGGGLGAAIEAIKCYNPELDCKLFDLEKVLAESSVCGVEKIAGDFFITIPGIHNAIILARVLHDWNDSKASIILQNCHKALQKDGTLYVIENCINSTSDSLALLSLNMSAMCESMERTDNEYIQLCELHGFHYETQKTLNKLQTILIFKKR